MNLIIFCLLLGVSFKSNQPLMHINLFIFERSFTWVSRTPQSEFGKRGYGHYKNDILGFYMVLEGGYV